MVMLRKPAWAGAEGEGPSDAFAFYQTLADREKNDALCGLFGPTRLCDHRGM